MCTFILNDPVYGHDCTICTVSRDRSGSFSQIIDGNSETPVTNHLSPGFFCGEMQNSKNFISETNSVSLFLGPVGGLHGTEDMCNVHTYLSSPPEPLLGYLLCNTAARTHCWKGVNT